MKRELESLESGTVCGRWYRTPVSSSRHRRTVIDNPLCGTHVWEIGVRSEVFCRRGRVYPGTRSGGSFGEGLRTGCL